jgi:hypothetical protein
MVLRTLENADMKTSTRFATGLAFAAGIALATTAHAADEPTIIVLTQTGCQFIESENNVDRGFTPAEKADCEAINGETGEARLSEAEPLHLKPGKYIFRVTNEDVPYMLGFYLRAESALERPFLPDVSGGGLTPGVTKDYEIELEEGEYVYSCPLNTTPDYALIVE